MSILMLGKGREGMRTIFRCQEQNEVEHWNTSWTMHYR